MAEAICLTSQRDSLDKFGCLKCHEGKEILAAQTASHLNRQIKATPVLITKRFTQKRVVRFDPIVDQWDSLGHFYASLERGYTTASTALKRLVSFIGDSHMFFVF